MNWDKIIPNGIKIAAVATAAPRWVGALLAAEGLMIPADWSGWWIILSASLSACMALVEGFAFAYVFEAWRNQNDKDGDNLLIMALISAMVFVVVLAPYIAASVKHESLDKILSTDALLWAWSVAVGLSTIAIVASVGYAQKRKQVRPVAKVEQVTKQEPQPDEPKSNRERALEIYQAHPGISQAQIAQVVGVSRQQVGKYLATAPQNGKAEYKNGATK